MDKQIAKHIALNDRINLLDDEISMALYRKGRVPRKFKRTFDRKTCRTIIDCGSGIKFSVDLRVL